MRLGDVLKKERTRKKLSVAEVSKQLDLSEDVYRDIEEREAALEEWGPKIAKIAIKLSVPTSRLISKTGKSADSKQEEGQCGKLIQAQREDRKISQQELADRLEVPLEEIILIEKGLSPLENFAPILLRYAELINQPIFNLFYPCGLPLDKLEDYS